MYLCNACYIVTHIRYRSKGSTPTRETAFQAVQKPCFLWERVTPFGTDFGLFHFADLWYAQKCYKHNITSLIFIFIFLVTFHSKRDNRFKLSTQANFDFFLVLFFSLNLKLLSHQIK